MAHFLVEFCLDFNGKFFIGNLFGFQWKTISKNEDLKLTLMKVLGVC